MLIICWVPSNCFVPQYRRHYQTLGTKLSSENTKAYLAPVEDREEPELQSFTALRTTYEFLSRSFSTGLKEERLRSTVSKSG